MFELSNECLFGYLDEIGLNNLSRELWVIPRLCNAYNYLEDYLVSLGVLEVVRSGGVISYQLDDLVQINVPRGPVIAYDACVAWHSLIESAYFFPYGRNNHDGDEMFSSAMHVWANIARRVYPKVKSHDPVFVVQFHSQMRRFCLVPLHKNKWHQAKLPVRVLTRANFRDNFFAEPIHRRKDV